MKKRLIYFFALILVFLTSIFSANAAPTHPWKALDNYKAAKNAEDNDGLIKHAMDIIQFYEGIEDTNIIKLDVTTPLYREIAEVYENRRQYNDALANYERYAQLAKLQMARNDAGKWNGDALRGAESKIMLINGYGLKVYTNADASAAEFLGSKYEPKNGILFGKSVDSFEKFKPNKESSIVSSYAYYKGEDFVLPDKFGIDMTNKYLLLNWNIKEDSYWMINHVPDQTEYITLMAKKFATYGPAFLRFAAEMDVWSTPPNKESYKKAFATVSNIMKKYAPNIAMIWSPNDICGFDINFEDYYPGDEYVDWVGMSAYTTKNFLGRNDWDDFTNASFMTGDYANPIIRIKKVVETYGDKKPIMITEGGFGYNSSVTGEDFRAWARKKMEFFYTYLPMVYPQIDAILHFDVHMPHSNAYFDLYSVSELQAAYNQLIMQDVFLSKKNGTTETNYALLTDKKVKGTINLYTYQAFPNTSAPKTAYYIDSKEVSVTRQIPYRYTLDTRKFSKGAHQLEVKIYDGDNLLDSKSFQLTFE